MRLLLDTHIWLWMLAAPDRLGSIRDMLADSENVLYLSAASAWEISIKYSIGRLVLPESPEHFVPDRLRKSGVLALPVLYTDTVGVASLPSHHKDPFDRLLVAQARNLGMTVVTADSQLAAYDVPTIRV